MLNKASKVAAAESNPGGPHPGKLQNQMSNTKGITASRAPKVICDKCGAPQAAVTWKGGGYNMTKSRPEAAGFVEEVSNKGDPGLAAEAYLVGLQQKVKLLELELSYLKQGGPTTGPETQVGGGGLEGDLRKLRKELVDKTEQLQEAVAANARLSNKVKTLEASSRNYHHQLQQQQQHQQHPEEAQHYQLRNNQLLDTVAELTTRCQQLETDLQVSEDRCKDTAERLEKASILCKDREHGLGQLQEQLDRANDTVSELQATLETSRNCSLALEKQLSDLQEKYLQSSAHVTEVTLNGLNNEIRNLQLKLTEAEMEREGGSELRARSDQRLSKLMGENAGLAASLTEARRRLESEIKVREGREARQSMEAQEVVALKDRERQAKDEINRLQRDLEKDRLKLKTSGEKLAKSGQEITLMELKLSTQRSRTAELEGSLAMAQEKASAIRKQTLVDHEKIAAMARELKVSRHECQGMAEKLAAVELKLHDADRRTEALATLQSHRWMEFSKMADSMKELSQNMLSQSKTNTRRAAIRADLDEELQDL